MDHSSDEARARRKEIKAVGKRLLRARSSIETDQLLALLSRAEAILGNIYQEPPKPTRTAFVPIMKALITDDLLRHADGDIQVAVASCLNEIIRIAAPYETYDEDQMKDIFKLFMVALKHLSSASDTINYKRGRLVLEALAKVRSCLIMLDLGIDAMVVEMFQLFLDTIRPNHSSDILVFMKTIMILVIEESDEISLELLRPLLASVRMDNKSFTYCLGVGENYLCRTCNQTSASS